MARDGTVATPRRARRAPTFLGRLAHALRDQNWPAVVIEIGIVVLGVVLGLQANNWNERRETENEVRALVGNLRSEFLSNRASLETTRADLATIMESSRTLLSLFGRQDTGLSEAELDNLIERTFFWPTWMPSNAVSRELMNSGALSVLDDDGIKSLLFEWERRMRHVDEWNRRMERSSQDLIDYVKDNGSLRNTNHRRIAVERSGLGPGNRPLLRDPAFENHIDEKLVMARFLADEYGLAADLVADIIRASEQYLGRGSAGSD